MFSSTFCSWSFNPSNDTTVSILFSSCPNEIVPEFSYAELFILLLYSSSLGSTNAFSSPKICDAYLKNNVLSLLNKSVAITA